MANKLLSCLLIGLFCLYFSPAEAGNFFDEPLDQIKMFAGDIKTIEVENLKRVSIRNPDIANVKKAEASEIVLSANQKGTTYLFFWDNDGKHKVKIKVYPEDITDLNKQIKEILESLELNSVRTKPLEEEGRILLLGTVRTGEEKKRIKEALGDIARKTTDLIKVEEQKLVEIEVKILEIQRDSTETLGFEHPSSITINEVAPVASPSWAKIFKVGSLQRSDNFNWTLDFLVQEGKARILSRPKLLCQSGKEAQLLVGGEKPIFEKIAGTGSTAAQAGGSVEYKDYGITLNMKPIVTDEGKIQIALEVNVVDVEVAETFEGVARAYPVTKRNFNTELFLNDGETLIMGGLIKQKTEEDLKKFPWLADIPILGAFFRHRTTTKGGGSGERGNQELFVTLTPKIIHPKEKTLSTKRKIEKKQKEDFLDLYESSQIPSELQNYILSVQKKILSRASYPMSLFGTGWTGKLLLKVKINQTGGLEEVKIIKPSGYKIFDNHALAMIQNLSFPSFPPEMQQEEVKIEIPIVYAEMN